MPDDNKSSLRRRQLIAGGMALGAMAGWPAGAAAQCLVSGPPEEALFDLGLLQTPAGDAVAGGRRALPGAPVWHEDLAGVGQVHDGFGDHGQPLDSVASRGAVRPQLDSAGDTRQAFRISGRFRDLMADAVYRPRRIPLFNIHTGEAATVEYYADGGYRADQMDHLDALLRDWRTDAVIRMDPRVIDILYVLWTMAETERPIHVLSAYRTAETNARLARTNPLVARNSLHIEGKAVDFYLPDGDLARLYDLAISLRGGGVGWYPRAGFLHVDCGPVRCWTA